MTDACEAQGVYQDVTQGGAQVAREVESFVSMATVRKKAADAPKTARATPAAQRLPRNSALRRVLEKELGTYDDERIYVRRFGRERNPAPVFNCAAKAFSLDLVRRRCGAGECQIEGRKSGQVVFRRRVRVGNTPPHATGTPATR